MKHFDAIVVGSGAMGSAVTYHLANRGLRTLNLEKFHLNHVNGSSHGKSRIIRTAYHEHSNYVPLVKRAFELWYELQDQSGNDLIRITGGLMFGTPDSELVSGALRSASEHSVQHKLLEAHEITEQFQVFRPSDEEVAILEPNAGILFPERCIKAHTALARNAGAEFHFNEPVLKWQADRDTIVARTQKETYVADSMIFAAGSWVAELLPDLNLPLQCERQTVFWFKPLQDAELLSAARMPVFIWQQRGGNYYYGVPDMGEGVKAAEHHAGEFASPDSIRREITQEDELPVRGFLKRHIPLAGGEIVSSTTCLYTNSPDGHFLIDFHPNYRNVIIVSACSGHGFKFATVIGELVSDMLLERKTKYDISLFSLSRFRLRESKLN